jgi:hypothetical protein
MFLRAKVRKKDGKEHRYWTVVESRRTFDGKVVQRDVLYLGELNDAQHAGWIRAIDVLCEGQVEHSQMVLFAHDQAHIPATQYPVVRVRLDRLALRAARQWGGCWLGLYLWDLLDLDSFWKPALPASRKGTQWINVLKSLVVYRLVDPGSEYRFHREWFASSAMADLLGESFRLAQKDKPYRCMDRLLGHKQALFGFLHRRWGELFDPTFDVLLYDLTSTYFEINAPDAKSATKKRFGYSRDHRPDCVQVVVALVMTPEGFPLAYEVLAGNTADNTTLDQFLTRIEKQYGRRRRTWLMDRGIPTEQTLERMRERGIKYLVGTPKGRLSKLEKQLVKLPWSKARQSVSVKLLDTEEDLYVLVESRDRVSKERAIRRRRLKRLWATLRELQHRPRLKRDTLLMALGAAKKEAGRVGGLVDIMTPKEGQTVTSRTFMFRLNRDGLRRAMRREGRYLLRSNLRSSSPETLWENYTMLWRIEQAFKDLKGDLGLRPIWHQLEQRIEAHIFVCFLAYALHVTLRNLARDVADGLTTHAIFSKLKSIQMIDVHLPTTDGRELVLSRYTQPSKDVCLLLARLGLTLPPQSPPKVYATGQVEL